MRIARNFLICKLPIGIAMLLCVNSQINAEECQYADTLMVLNFSSSLYDTNYGLYVVDKKGKVRKHISPMFVGDDFVPPKRGDEIVAKMDSATGHLIVYRNLTVEKMREYFIKKSAQKYK